MKKIIPFKKEIEFSTEIKEITSISLEHEYNVEEDLISGKFIINGDYLINQSSINKEEYNYIIPFEIALDSRYDTNTVNLDIDNFYYEVIGIDILKVNIDVLVTCEYKEEREVIELPNNIINIEEDNKVEKTIDIEVNNEENNISIDNIKENNIDIEINNTNDNNISLFDNINMEDTYSVYHVYIVKEEDTIDNIITKYEVTKEELEKYNDLSFIKPLDKIIVPCNNE